MIPISEHPFGAGGLCAKKLRLESNGLQAILVRDPSAPLCAYQTWLRVGSRHERAGKTGIAHLFEHLMFNQTETLAPGEFDRRLETVGAETNAATWVDWTYYRDNLPREQLDLVMSLEADRLAHLVVHDPQVESEREVVMNERRFRVDDDVEGFLAEQLFRLAYTSHPYHWPTIGWMEDIRAITTDDARAFYRTYYAPNNATLVLVGDFDERLAADRIEAHYGAIPPSVIPVEAQVHEPPQEGERRGEWKKAVASDRLLIGWRGCGLGDEDHAAIEVAIELLAGGQSSRLHRRLVIESEVASTVNGAAPEFRDPGLCELTVALQRGRRAAEAERMIAQEIERLAERAVDEAELAKAQNRLEARHWHGLRPMDGKAEALGHWETTAGDYSRLFSVAERVRAVQPEEVRRVFERYLAPSLRTVVCATPARRRS
ncbi:MAG: insulinase family protein [Myxococcales bacterium]|nr:insulinase family protein [Myxococcales bacterium]